MVSYGVKSGSNRFAAEGGEQMSREALHYNNVDVGTVDSEERLKRVRQFDGRRCRQTVENAGGTIFVKIAELRREVALVSSGVHQAEEWIDGSVVEALIGAEVRPAEIHG